MTVTAAAVAELVARIEELARERYGVMASQAVGIQGFLADGSLKPEHLPHIVEALACGKSFTRPGFGEIRVTVVPGGVGIALRPIGVSVVLHGGAAEPDGA